MVLVATSVWIDFFTGKASPQVEILELLISEEQDICTCGIIMTEMLQGIRDDKQYKKIKSYFDNLIFLPMSQHIFIKSADLYRSLRKQGITIRKPLDCIIASVAIAHGIQLLHNDRDFDYLEKHCGLKTLKNKVR